MLEAPNPRLKSLPYQRGEVLYTCLQDALPTKYTVIDAMAICKRAGLKAESIWRREETRFDYCFAPNTATGSNPW